MDTWQVTAGIAAQWTVTLADEAGAAITSYTGSEALAGSVRPGRAVAPVATLAPTWASAPAGTVNVPIAGTATATLAPGLYLVQVKLADNSADLFEGLLDVGYAPGTDTLPAVYCSFDDMLDYCPWLGKLQTPKDLTGFAKQRGRARSWLDDILVASFKYTNMGIQSGEPGFLPSMTFGGYQASPPNVWLKQQLDLNCLKVTDQVKEITAKKAIFLVCLPQLSQLKEEEVVLARMFGKEADSIVKLLRAEVVLDSTQPPGPYDWASIVIHCGATSLR